MDKEFIKLYQEFKRIRNKGYIKGIYNSNSSIGRTFENELGLEMNKNSTPDYNGIELKTRRTYSKSQICLFTAVPDGEDILELSRIKEVYGYPSKYDKNYKVLYAEIYGNKLNFGGAKYQYKLHIDRNKEKVYLDIYNKKGVLLEEKVYWSFNYLKNKLFTKLSKLAIINAWPKEIDGWNYFKYYKINFYILKSFEDFLKLLENGDIILKIKIDIYLHGDKYGKMYDHGSSFSISEDNIIKLFDKIM